MAMSVCLAMPEGAFRDQIVYQLEHQGNHLVTVDRGEDLLNQIRKGFYNHIIIHTELPDYDALELVLYIRDMHGHTPITVISRNQSVLRRQILMAGANYWLSPKDSVDTLIHILKSTDSQMLIQS